MVDYVIIQNAGIALLLGFLLGAEREKAQMGKKVRDFAGIRSFILITLIGYFAAFITKTMESSFIVYAMSGVIGLIIASYIYDAFKQNKKGITAELAAIMAFIIGVLTFFHVTTAVIITIVVTLILSQREYLHAFIGKVSQDEIYATLKFAIIAFIVLPLLPNYTIDPWGVVNIYNIWLMVVFISGISFVGYLLTKIIGVTKGIGITGFIGGLVSSTAVTSSMSNESLRNKKIVFPFILAVIAASGMMFGRVLIVTAILNSNLLQYITVSLGFMIVTSIIFIILLWWKSETGVKYKEFALESPFQFIPALKFGLFFLGVLVLSKILNNTLGESGLYITAVISGLADVDAITISMSQLAAENPALEVVAAKTITIAVIANTVVKGGIAYYFGSKKFSYWVIAAMGIILASGIIGIFII